MYPKLRITGDSVLFPETLLWKRVKLACLQFPSEHLCWETKIFFFNFTALNDRCAVVLSAPTKVVASEIILLVDNIGVARGPQPQCFSISIVV